MRAVGIVAEYNPLHYGHIYHIEESKKLAGKDAVVVAMSGNFVQHGEPAILDKWERAQMALNYGADIVLEIPAAYCVGNSMQFATAGVKLLEAIGVVEDISFGSESGDIKALNEVADNILSHSKELSDEISFIAKTSGCSFPVARELAYKKLFGGDEAPSVLAGSNDNLALSYIMASEKLNAVAVKRVGAAYNDGIDEDLSYQSATGIRLALKSNEGISKYVPEGVETSIKASKLTFPDEWLNILKYSVMSMTAEEIDECPSGGEGLGNKIKAEINTATSWDGLIKAIKSKRYTYSRISRLCIQIILGINRSMTERCNPGYIRVLGLSKRGRELLSSAEREKIIALPIITNVGRSLDILEEDARNLLEMDIHSSDVYNLVTGRDIHTRSDYRMKPIIQE